MGITLETFKLKRPGSLRTDPAELLKIIDNLKGLNLQKETEQYIRSPYLYWDVIKYKSRPKGISADDFWSLVKFIRKLRSSPSPIKSENGEYFTWIKLPDLEPFLHEIDFHTGGSLISSIDMSRESRFAFISRGVIEEAIASSQLEGANTTREAAKQMLREERKPSTVGEQMILNNYKSMKAIEENYKNRKLDFELLLELHRMIVEDTDVSKEEIGRLRTDKEKILVTGEGDQINTVYHKPPRMKFVKAETERLIAFANDSESNEDTFVHPVVKAIMLHFWMGYLHPFTNGNGRLARLLFYWYLLRHDYWGFGYLPISAIIKRSPAQYRMAYLYTEQDALDLTYFIDYNVCKIKQAMKKFDEYVRGVSALNRRMNTTARTRYNLNERQIRLLQYFYRKKDQHTTTTIHRNINQISRITAIKDLKDLRAKGFLMSKKVGKEVFYYSSDKIAELF